jgi:hypothetical protein
MTYSGNNMSLSSAALGVVLIASLPHPGFEESLHYHRFPNITRTQSVPNCYAQTHNNKKFDLTRLCGSTPTSKLTGGVCNTPNTASNISRCTDSSASKKKSGQ